MFLFFLCFSLQFFHVCISLSRSLACAQCQIAITNYITAVKPLESFIFYFNIYVFKHYTEYKKCF